MTKDFKQQPSATSEDSGFNQYGFSWMLGGVAIGLLVGLAMYALNNRHDTTANTSTAQATTTSPIVTASVATATTTPDVPTDPTPTTTDTPNFSYHAVLPQLEVDVPMLNTEPVATKAVAEKTPTATPKADKPTTSNTAAPTGFNGYQVGSYKVLEQATALQASLKKHGMASQLSKATINGETWYRVRVGPAPDAATLQHWQQTLSGMGISALSVRM